MSWPQIKKIIILKCLLLFYATTTSHFSIGLWCVMKNGFYMTTSSVVGPRRNSQNTSQSQTCTEKKVILIVWWSAAYLINYSFLNPCETITSEKHAQQINGMHWKLQHLQLVLVNRKRPILHENTQPDIAQPTYHMLNELGYEVLPHLPYSPDLLPTDDHFFKHLDNFCRENASTTSQIQKTPSMSLSNPGAWIFTEQE